MTDELRSGIQAAIDAYKRRGMSPPQPGPLVVPDWFPAACALEGKDDAWIGEQARAFGFDGWLTVSQAWS